MGNSSSHQDTSYSLLSRVRADDQRAWTQLVELYLPLVGYWCRRYDLNPDDAADLQQNVFLSVARGIRNFQPRPNRDNGSFRPWLWVITRNKINDLLRKRRLDVSRGGSSMLLTLNQLSDCQLDDEPSDENALQGLVNRALEQIRPNFQPSTWQAFWLTVMEGQPNDIVSEQLGLRPTSIRQAKTRVLRQLRKQLGDCL